MRRAKFVVLFVASLAALLIASSCAAPEPEIIEKEVTVVVEKEVEVPVEVEVEVPVEVEVEVPLEPEFEVPFEAAWAGSRHNEVEAEAFRHWDEDDPALVSASCAKCHSTYGYLDFLGVDGTAVGTVDNDAEIDSTVECVACHNEATLMMDSVTFPSGVEATGLGDESRCMQCHQGRASMVSVNDRIAEAGVADDDTVSEDLGFINIHYYAAGASRLGGVVMGGYQYEGKTYDAKFAHVEGIDTCIDCHDPHTLEVKVEVCAACHTEESLEEIRWLGSVADYDGDGDVTEGVADEIAGLRDVLYQGIQSYASGVAGSAIVYDSHAYPYFFMDTNENGEPDEDEAVYANQYASWTGRLMKAAYNYQTSIKDPGGFAHGGKYIIQLLYDSIEDLDASMLGDAHRDDPGHFAGSSEAFRHWDEDGEVRSSCAKCHSATGLPTFLSEGVSVSEPLANGLLCSTCHDAVPGFTRYEVTEVKFPSGSVLDTGDPDSNLCLNCHQGRSSTVAVDGRIAGLPADTVSEDVGFMNVHYFAAGATLFGTDAKGAYEYQGQTYNGRNAHVEGFDACIECHDSHSLEVKEEACGGCHAGAEEPEDIRMDASDYDGDGDAAEGIAGEIETVRDALYEAIQAYATDTAGVGIEYDSHRYPYFFSEDGERYGTWTPRLLQATYNYQYAMKDPGAFAHNPKYMIQVLYDSLADIGGSTAGMTRP